VKLEVTIAELMTSEAQSITAIVEQNPRQQRERKYISKTYEIIIKLNKLKNALRAVPSLIFQFFKIAFFKTKNFLSRLER